jgi:tetratricopeptide (TPR) repeat protein
MVNASQAWLHLGDTRRAIEFARQALRVDAGNWKAHAALSNALMVVGDYVVCRDCLEAARRLNPKAMEPIVNLVMVHEKLGDLKAAQRWLRTAIEHCTKKADFSELNHCSNQIAEWLPGDQALAYLDRIVADRPDAAIALNNRAILLRRLGRLSEALASAGKALELNPVYAKAWSNQATILLQLERPADAIASADQAIALDPLLTGPYLAKASALSHLGQMPKARETIARGLALMPQNKQLLHAETAFWR